MLWLKSPKSQLSKTFSGLKIHWILRKLWAKTCLYVFWASFFTFDIHSLWSIIHSSYHLWHLPHLWHGSNYIAFDLLLRSFTSPTSSTWVTLLCIVLPLIFYWYISYLWRLWHETWVTFPLIFYWDPCYIVVVRDIKDVFAHIFLNIQQIFNLEKVLESWDLGLSKHIKFYVCWRWFELHCVCNAVYVGDVKDITKWVQWVLCFIYLLSETLEVIWITLWIIIETIQIVKYFELMLRITWNFELKPCINSN